MVVTFLPFEDFSKSARVLDYRRLGKQRLEAKQIIKALENLESAKPTKPTKPSRGWTSHPATLMWKGFIPLLKFYYNTIVLEWISRGYKNTMELFPTDFDSQDDFPKPWWMGWPPFHYSHQASLIHKNPDYYYDLFKTPELYLRRGYIWPTRVERTSRHTPAGAPPLPTLPPRKLSKLYFEPINELIELTYIIREGIGIPTIPAKVVFEK